MQGVTVRAVELLLPITTEKRRGDSLHTSFYLFARERNRKLQEKSTINIIYFQFIVKMQFLIPHKPIFFLF